MKKVFLSLAVIATVALASCGGHKAEKEAQDAQADAPEAVVEEGAAEGAVCENDSCCADSLVVVEESAALASE